MTMMMLVLKMMMIIKNDICYQNQQLHTTCNNYNRTCNKYMIQIRTQKNISNG
jgi:hypothetical protein